MGKGYNNYMCKKPFHPGSKANIKRAWMAEQKTESEKKKQEELKVQYEKEQDLYNNRALISSESKDKLELNFMYEAPPGAKRERQKEDDEPEYKFEWQRKYNAPREDYAKGNEDIKDQPFGIPVRNVRCIKCHKWGHINTDKECPLFSQASTSSMPTTSMDPMELMRQMREDGFGLKENVLGHHLNPRAANQQFIPSEESDPETEFLKSLSRAEKKKLLRKLKKLSKKQEKLAKSKKKKSKKSCKSKSKNSSDSDFDGKKTKKKKKHQESSSSSSDSSSNESEEKCDDKWNRNRTKLSKAEKKVKNHKVEESDSDSEAHTYSKRSTKYEQKSSNKSSGRHHSKSLMQKEDTKIKNKTNKSEYSNKRHEDLKESKSVIKSNWKSSYSSSGSENEGFTRKQLQEDSNSKKHKAEGPGNVEGEKRIKTEKQDSDPSYKQVPSKPDHPDGFSHLCPQARIEANYVPASKEYIGEMHDRFRDLYRDARSPSIKQKYNN